MIELGLEYMGLTFDKYKRYGGYHWRWYGSRVTYRRHVDFLARWVKEKNTLIIGAGDGFIASKLGIRGVDNNKYAIKLASTRDVKIDYTNGSRLPYKKEEFDSALMPDTIQGFKNLSQALAEAKRVIRNYLYVSIPAVNKVIEPGTYHVWKQPSQLAAAIKKSGFKLVGEPIFKPDRKRYYFKFQKA